MWWPSAPSPCADRRPAPSALAKMTRKGTAMSRARATNAQKLLSTVRTSAKPQNGRCVPVRWNARQLLNRGNPAMVLGARTSNKSNLRPECKSNAAALISGAGYRPASTQSSKPQIAIGHELVPRYPMALQSSRPGAATNPIAQTIRGSACRLLSLLLRKIGRQRGLFL